MIETVVSQPTLAYVGCIEVIGPDLSSEVSMTRVGPVLPRASAPSRIVVEGADKSGLVRGSPAQEPG
jgi:hypothetical protein